MLQILEGRSYVDQGQNSDMGERGIKNGQKNSVDSPFD